jgi:hypothetical protein
MNKIDSQINRLLKAAAKVDHPAEDRPPFGFASRVICEWRTSIPGSADLSYASLCKRAVLCSYGVAVLVFLLNIQALESFRELDAWHAVDVRLLDSAVQLHIP